MRLRPILTSLLMWAVLSVNRPASAGGINSMKVKVNAVSGHAATVQLTDPIGRDAKNAIPVPAASFPIMVECGARVLGDSVVITLVDGMDAQAKVVETLVRVPDVTPPTYTVDGSRPHPGAAAIRVCYRGQCLTQAAAFAATRDKPPQEPPTVDQLIHMCDGGWPDQDVNIEGDSGRQVVFVVTPRGEVLRRPTRDINEKDEVVVYVYADPRAFKYLKVKRSSAIRVPGSVSLAGAGTSLAAAAKLFARSDETEPSLACAAKAVRLGDFSEGRGEVQLLVTKGGGDQGKDVVVGSFDFVVHKLYHGVLSFGPVMTHLPSKEFGRVRRGGEQVIAETQTGGRAAYALCASLFLGGPRGLDEPRISPDQSLL